MEMWLGVLVFFGLNVFGAAQNDQNETSSGLRCYFCAATGGGNICEDFNTYKVAMDGTGNAYVKKDCTYPYNETCFIESFAVNGFTTSHIRDCGDGRHFSFSSNLQANRSAYRRLENLAKINETACVWDGQHLVCLTLCTTNFCNGPQLHEVSGAVLFRLSTCLLISILIANMYQRQK